MTKPADAVNFTNYLATFSALLANSAFATAAGELPFEDGLLGLQAILLQLRDRRGSLYIIGNGGSAGVASHAVVDFVNVAKINAFTLHDSSLLTCMANDYGYENAFAKLVAQFAKPGDALIAISSSGKSKNICNAALQAKAQGATVITLSGFSAQNPLRTIGDHNIWLNSENYGHVEIGHQFILHNLSDRFKDIYSEA